MVNTPSHESLDKLITDPNARVKQYVELHNINGLFETLGTLLLYHKPTNPKEFLIEELQQMQKAKAANIHNSFFNEYDLKAMFNAFDITERGFVTPEQYAQALKNLGIEKPTLRLPEGISTVSEPLFMRSMMQELKNSSASM